MGNLSAWDSLIINKRHPHTYRAMYQNGPYRICLHRFEECEPEDAFYHPHPWPGAFKILKGAYRMKIGYAASRIIEPKPVATFIMSAGSSYEITDPLTFHTVEPLGGDCYTVMVSGEPWDRDTTHQQCRTTKGAQLEKMSELTLKLHLETFRDLLK